MSKVKTFSSSLYYYREERGLSQYEMSDICNISLRHYQDLEAGKSEPKLSTALYISSVTGISLDMLRKEMLFCLEYTYYICSRRYKDENNIFYISYGLKCFSKYGNKLIMKIDDISTDKAFVIKLMELCKYHQVLPVHLYDIVLDYIA